jgi:hypothetical protein
MAIGLFRSKTCSSFLGFPTAIQANREVYFVHSISSRANRLASPIRHFAKTKGDTPTADQVVDEAKAHSLWATNEMAFRIV